MSSRTTIYATTLDRLCREADALERVWDHPDVDAGSVTHHMLAVLAALEQAGARRSRAAQADEAARLLRFYCRRNSRRDIARAADLRARGVRPIVISLDALTETGWDAPGAHPQADWLRAAAEEEDARTLPCDVARFLEGCGWPRERAWMFVWAEYEGREWKAVASLLEERFGLRATPAAVRKWAERHWAAVRADMGEFWRRRQAGADVTDARRRGTAKKEEAAPGAWTRRKEVTPMNN